MSKAYSIIKKFNIIDEMAVQPEAGTLNISYNPKKTKFGYKLFRKKKDGKLYPLFIGAKRPTPIGVWIEAEFIPTKGFAQRPGWHMGILPVAPHLRKKSTGGKDPNRVWALVEYPTDVNWQSVADKSKTKDIRDKIPKDGYYKFKRSKMQGGFWIIAGAVKIIRELSDREIYDILKKAGFPNKEILKELTNPDEIIN